MRIHILALFLAFSVSIQSGLAQSLLHLDGEEATSIGIYIKDLRTGNVIAQQNPQLALTPASVMKAVTTATALSICGADTCFTTAVGLSGKVNDGVCHGDLVVSSCADPTLESDNFKNNKGFCDRVVAALRDRGIRRIEGTIVVDQRLRDAGPNLQWEVEDIAWSYGAALHGFNWRDNTVTVTPATGEVVPEAPGLEVCVEKAADNDIVRGAFSNRLTIFARDPDKKDWKENVTVPDPAAVFTCQMRRALENAGIEVGDVRACADTSFTTVYIHRSPIFGDIMHSLMVRSDNLFAEGMLRSIAPASSRETAIKRERALWQERGVSPRHATIKDGSGLARSNRLTPLFIASVLEWMAKSPMGDTYTSFFPRAGKEGTMRGFLAKSPLAGSIALKTGSVGGVQCYAGYKFDNNDKPTHVIVIMVNSFFCPRRQVRTASEKLLKDLFLKK